MNEFAVLMISVALETDWEICCMTPLWSTSWLISAVIASVAVSIKIPGYKVDGADKVVCTKLPILPAAPVSGMPKEKSLTIINLV